MNETILNARQEAILEIISRLAPVSRANIARKLPSNLTVSRPTLLRDLDFLEQKGFIKKSGAARATVYISKESSLLQHVNIGRYFTRSVGEREIVLRSPRELLDEIDQTPLLTIDELAKIAKIHQAFREKTSHISPTIFRKELERFTIELSYKSSKIEGNTYSLLETEQLIKSGETSGHSREETDMILNHKRAIDYIMKDAGKFRQLNLSDILEIHQILVYNLDVETGLRRNDVRITGTKYLPPGSGRLREFLLRTTEIVNQRENPVEKALIVSALIAYLQPFAVGNKRTARVTGNAVLLGCGFAPLSYRDTPDIEYKKAVLLFDEAQNLSAYKRIFSTVSI